MKQSTLALAAGRETVIPADTEVSAPSGEARTMSAVPAETAETAPPKESPKLVVAVHEWINRVDWGGFVRSLSVQLLSLIGGIVLWHYACKYEFQFFVKFDNVPPPLVVFESFLKHIQDATFYIHVAVSVQRILISFAIATALGIVLGVLMGRSRTIRNIVVPHIEILRPIPAVAWIPMAILMWPTEESSIIYITLLGALFPIILNTVHGVEQTPEVLVRAAQSLGASRLQIFWHVVMPAALPSISTGLAIGMGVSWFSLLAGEIISGQYGIGYFTWNAYSLINYPDIVVGMLVIGILGTLSTMAVRKITQPLLSWQRKSR